MEYEKCLVELNEVLKFLPVSELSKIPQEIRDNINRKKDSNYKWKYDETKKLSEQKLNRKTVIMLSYLNMEFLLNEEQRKLMDEFHKRNEEKAENLKNEKYNADNLFKNNNINDKTSVTALTKVEEEKWYSKLFKFIKSFFKK